VDRQWVIDGLLFWAVGMSIGQTLSVLFWQWLDADMLDADAPIWGQAFIRFAIYGAMLVYSLASAKREHTNRRNCVHAKH
jgi:hypothetical protein